MFVRRMASVSSSKIPKVDISAFEDHLDSVSSFQAARELVAAAHQTGFVSLKGHGVPTKLLEEAFEWSKRFFDLPLEEKMKAPHPPAYVPHRGYSHPGAEKVYSKHESEDETVVASNGKILRKIQDFKESFEIGAESNADQSNIWLTESILPGFREFELGLYRELHHVCARILRAICVGLNLSAEDTEYALKLHSGYNNQLRLLHYPSVEAEELQTQVLQRMPAHTDWSSFTILFQDDCGGLELEDTSSPGTFIPAEPEEGALILNVGDMLERLSNDYLRSATHRVTIPPIVQEASTFKEETRARYSIPYFFAPDPDKVLHSFKSCVTTNAPAKYQPVTWRDYGELRGKYGYEAEREGRVPVHGNSIQ